MTLLQQTENAMLTRLREMAEKSQTDIRALKKDEISQSSRGSLRYTIATLPTPTADMIGWHAYVTDGLKPGEVSGTGCEMVCDGTAWVLPSSQLATSALTATSATSAASATLSASVPVYTFAGLPTPSVGLLGYVACVSNGRKSGETAGNGTGVMVVCLNGSGGYLWRLTSDYSAVTA